MQEVGDLRKEASLNIDTDSEKLAFWKRVVIFGAGLVIVFLLGLIPTWMNGLETARQRDAAQANLRLSQLQNRLATAALSARRGEYEPARVAASDFFTDLRAEFDRAESGFNDRQREAVRPILDERDEIITLLARYDPSSAERLTDMYLEYTKTISPPVKKPE